MTPPSPDFQQNALLVFMVGLAAFLAILAGASTVYKNIVLARAVKNPPRNPPSEEEAAKTYATKADVQTMKCEWMSRCQEMHARCDKTFGEIFSILRAQNKEITDRLDAFHADLSEWQRGMERQIGNIEGKLDQ